jgi:hypothetical protein
MSENKDLKEVICCWLDDYTWSLRSAEVNYQMDKNPKKYTESQFNIRSTIADMIISKCKREFIKEENNIKILTDLIEYLKEKHSNLPSHVFETLGEVIDDLNQNKDE